MNYELCKKLKEAGFPQTSDDCYSTDAYGHIGASSAEYGVGRWLASIPTLSELIEECGKKFSLLSATPEGQWEASSVYEKNEEGIAENHELYGSTPEEAVANLWLALKQQS